MLLQITLNPLLIGIILALIIAPFVIILLRRKRELVTNCGHKTKNKDVIEAFGEKIITELPVRKGKTAYCHRCIEKMAIQCAWCGKPIFIGTTITLYSPSKNHTMPAYAVKFSDSPLLYVGCPRPGCADTGADYCGTWLPPGRVVRYPSILEKLSSQMGNPGATFETTASSSGSEKKRH